MWKKCFLVLMLSFLGCGEGDRAHTALPAGSVVLALGDSLTYGVGASNQEAWPVLLSQSSGWTVINGGVSGDTSGQALARLPALLAEHRPALVLVGIGGNDFLRRLPEGETRGNIDEILRLIKEQSAQAVLIGVPELGLGAALGFPDDHDLYADLAKAHDVPLLSGAWGKVMREKEWMSDQVHPNARGYAEFARYLQDFLRDKGLL